jgi:mannose-6-phosphate isomerase
MRTAPIRFMPLPMERVWGGRMLETHFAKTLPDPSAAYGESWEVVDRVDAQSAAGDVTLHDLWTQQRDEVFGKTAPAGAAFPLLIKILDARDRLSIQVHPPAAVAARLGGEPKTEMWYIAHAEPDAALYVGVQPGIDRAAFAAAVAEGSVESCVHCLPVRAGDFMFIPSGRLHAIGAGLVIFEIQQNSDTTYRVFDWNRPGTDGRPRELHVAESLACIDFSDTAPRLDQARGTELVRCEHFVVERFVIAQHETAVWGEAGEFSILAVVEGRVRMGETELSAGDVVLIPASMLERNVRASAASVLLKTRWP